MQDFGKLVDSRIQKLETDNLELHTKFKKIERVLTDALLVIKELKKKQQQQQSHIQSHIQSRIQSPMSIIQKPQEQVQLFEDHADGTDYLDNSTSSMSSARLKRQYDSDDYFETRYNGNTSKQIKEDSIPMPIPMSMPMSMPMSIHLSLPPRIVSDPRLNPVNTVYRKTQEQPIPPPQLNAEYLTIESYQIPSRIPMYHEPVVPFANIQVLKSQLMACFRNNCNVVGCNYAHNIDELRICTNQKCSVPSKRNLCCALLHSQKEFDILKAKIYNGDKVFLKCFKYGCDPKSCNSGVCRKLHHYHGMEFDISNC